MPRLAVRRPGRASLAGRRFVAVALVAAAGAPVRAAAAQTLEDGFTVPRGQLRSSVVYANERWSSYWEGSLKRTNDNIGTLRTRSVTWSGVYGVTDRVSLLATLPYVWTSASQGVLKGMQGSQDVTVAAKARLVQTTVGTRATLGMTALAGAGAPTTNYTPDFQPLSIGLAARRALVRGALHLQDRSGLYAEGTMAHTWRSTVHLDRPAYYTDGQLVLSDEVAMPDVADYAVAVGYQRGPWCIPASLVTQHTLGGGDIRRQDMPFVSNRMDFTRAQLHVMYGLPFRSGLTVEAGAMRTLGGRNVGASTALSAGLTTSFRL